jgi:hypothetical protein
MLEQRKVISLLLLAAVALAPATALAGGVEVGSPGAKANARGGAVAARADDPMVLVYNPAGLAELRGSQFLIDFNIALMNACVDPIGYYGWGVYDGGEPARFVDPQTGAIDDVPLANTVSAPDGSLQMDPAANAYYSDPLDTVCLTQKIVAVPQLIWASRLSERVGIGFGLVFPSAHPVGHWGGPDGLIRGDTGELRPSPLRYMQLQFDFIGVFPTVGVGVRIIDELRLGLAVQWGMISFDSRLMTHEGPGTSPARDIVLHLHGEDMFVPAVTASFHLVPVDALDIVGAFNWQDKIEGEGEVDVITGLFDPMQTPYTNTGIEASRVRQYMPWKLTGAIRYADRRRPRPEGTGNEEADEVLGGTIHDPLTDEVWDVEVDLEYQMNSKNDVQRVDFPQGQSVRFMNAAGELGEPIPFFEAGFRSEVPKQWKDQLVVRAGGTWNVIESVLGVSLGAHYETRGVDPDYMQLDFWPLQRIGLHGGFTIRMLKTVDLVVSYGHVFQETIEVAPPDHCALDDDTCSPGFDKRVGFQTGGADDAIAPKEEPAVQDPDGTARLQQVVAIGSSEDAAWVVNSGTYRSSYDIIAFGLNLHF